MSNQAKRQKAIIEKFYESFRDSFFDEPEARHPEALKAFQKAEFGEDTLQQLDEFNRWMYEENSRNKRIYAFCEEQVVGQQSAIGLELSVLGEKVPSAYAIDLRVRPEWKMKGLGVAMIGSIMKKYELLIGLGVSDEAFSMFSRQGWKDMGKLDYLIKPVSWRGLLTSKSGGLDRLKRLAATAYCKLGDWLSRNSHRDFKLSPVDLLDENIDQLYQAYQKSHITYLRNAEELSWRYQSFKFTGDYELYELSNNQGVTVALAVLHRIMQDNKQVVMISEIVSEEKYYPHLLCAIDRLLREKPADVISYQGCDKEFVKALKKQRYFERPYGSRFMFYTENEALASKLSDRNKWRVSSGDSDLEFHL
ncbi:GNAT family N-acetyltransferase [Aliikangiella sp. G2MR2-5]|uniref:GNAT family N-acetyltransferase n=1 Tax=Aliikangiella sp. G2MR2-5 TaxID=2788943 RepID=UPI0018AB8DC4|nr:GNAT family N-acetyltransferase [Aliikangiella sp. G2MR2-5]